MNAGQKILVAVAIVAALSLAGSSDTETLNC